MLPDYPQAKSDLWAALHLWLSIRMRRYMPGLEDARATRFFEGATYTLQRETGEIEKDALQRMRSEIELSHEEVERLDLEGVFARLDEIARDLAVQIMGLAYSKVAEAAESVGNVVHYDGANITAADIVAITQKTEIDFDAKGLPRLPMIYANPQHQEALRQALEELHNNPVYARKLGEVLDRKREEWRAREADRVLVG